MMFSARSASVILAFIVPLSACSSSSQTPATSVGDASTDGGPDATMDASLVCGNADAASRPRCQRGDACHCDDQGSVAPICVAGEWKCAPGTTRYEDCHGVPPALPCTLDDAGVAHGADGG